MCRRVRITVCGLLLVLLGSLAVAQQTAPSRSVGINSVPLNGDLAERLGLPRAEGVLVTRVYTDSSAERAGIRPGDVILQFASTPATSLEQLRPLVEASPLGSRQPIVVWRQRQQAALELSIDPPPAVATKPRQPGPTTDERWYLHGMGDYWFRQPIGWTNHGRRNGSQPDPNSDSIISPDQRTLIVCARGYSQQQADGVEMALQRFRASSLEQQPQGRAVRFRVGPAAAVKISFLTNKGQFTASRILFCHEGRSYQIQTISPASGDLDKLDAPIAEALASLQFIWGPASLSGSADAANAGSLSSPSAPSRPAEAASPAFPSSPPLPILANLEQASPAPADWVTKKIGDIAVSVPPNWTASEFAAEDEAMWFLGSPLQPEASFQLVRDAAQNDLLRGGQVKSRCRVNVGRDRAECFEVEIPAADRPEKGLVIVLKRAGGSSTALSAFALTDRWATHQKAFEQMLAYVRVGGEKLATETPHPQAKQGGTAEGKSPDTATQSSSDDVLSSVVQVHVLGNVSLHIPADWIPATDHPPDQGRWAKGKDRPQWACAVLRAKTHKELLGSLRPLHRTSNFRVGGRDAAYYTGIAPEMGPRGFGSVAVLDQPEQDGRYLAFVTLCSEANRPRFSEVFSPIHNSIRIQGERDRSVPVGAGRLRPAGRIAARAKIEEFQGEADYGYTAYQDAVVLRDNPTGREETVWVREPDPKVTSRFQSLLQRDPEMAKRLGTSMSAVIRAFDEKLRVQVFEGGAIVRQEAFDVNWIDHHQRRVAEPRPQPEP